MLIICTEQLSANAAAKRISAQITVLIMFLSLFSLIVCPECVCFHILSINTSQHYAFLIVLFSLDCSPTGIVPCPATPTTFGHIRAANGQGQQRRRITSIQPPTGLQEWLRTFQVSTLELPPPFWATPNPRAKAHQKADVVPNQCSLSL